MDHILYKITVLTKTYFEKVFEIVYWILIIQKD